MAGLCQAAAEKVCSAACQSPANAIVAENCRPGSYSTEWDVNGAGDPTIQGFATEISVTQGELITFKVDTDATEYDIDIYRLGYYGGLGARHFKSLRPSARLPQMQPNCTRDVETRLVDCGNWAPSASWWVPKDAVSGLYIARLTRPDPPRTWRQDDSQAAPGAWVPGAPTVAAQSTDKDESIAPAAQLHSEHAYGAKGRGRLRNALRRPRASLIYFVVRNDEADAALLFQTSDTTWNAYNPYGGTTMYGALGSDWDAHPPMRRSYKASYNRPLVTRAVRAINAPFGAEYPMLRWLEENGFDMSYTTGVDMHTRGPSILRRHKVFLSVGHDEYWSGQQRAAVEAARDQGVHLAFFSGNEVFWRVRWEPSEVVPPAPPTVSNDGDGAHTEGAQVEGMAVGGHERVGVTAGGSEKVGEEGRAGHMWKAPRTMVCYKETHATARLDPYIEEWTGTWRDGRALNPLGAQPENALSGTIYMVDTWANYPIVVPHNYAAHRFWRNTSVESTAAGRHATLMKGAIGHEFDEDVDNGFRPAGLMRLSSTTLDGVVYLQDEGSVFDSGTATHSLVLHRHQGGKGAWVFGAGSCQWAFGLDPNHDSPASVPPHLANPYSTRVGLDLAAPDHAMQQATINLFGLMGVQPATLLSSLVHAEACTDAIPPAVSLTVLEPVFGNGAEERGVRRSQLQGGGVQGEPVRAVEGARAFRMAGTATDDGAGVVASVELSSDGGQKWHPAEPTSQAFATFEGHVEAHAFAAALLSASSIKLAPMSCGTLAETFQVRAVDDCGNMATKCFIAF